ncbi:MAG TPA: tetratricopeptide repeat protein, partial [Ktedonobacteraceae bacterium]
MASKDDSIINKLFGSYRIISKIASGGFAIVYQGEHIILTERKAAIKLLHSKHLDAAYARESFIQEARLLETLRHPHILPLYDVNIDNDGVPYLIAEYAPNGSLEDRIKLQSSQLMPIDEVLTILSQIGEALEHAHERNVIHRDLKPANILFNARGDALLADFGIATVLDGASGKQGDIMGTPPYMAPEQFQGMFGKDSDQYALGCIAYELVTGRRPLGTDRPVSLLQWIVKHTNENVILPTQYNPTLPIHIEQAILKALAKDRNKRHTNIGTFINAVLTTSPTSTHPKPQKKKGHWLDEALAHHQAKRYQEALQAYERAIQFNRSDTQAYHGKGDILWYLNHYEEALAAYQMAVSLAPNNAGFYRKQGDLLSTLHRYEEALNSYERATQLDPHDADAYIGKGNVLTELAYWEQALAAYKLALHYDPSNAHCFVSEGNAFWKLNRYEEALTAYERAIQLASDNAAAHYGKGVVLQEMQSYKGALIAYEQAIQLDSTNALAYHGKGNTLSQLKRYEEALAAYDQALLYDPDDTQVCGARGDVLYILKRYTEALAAYDQALIHDSANADLHKNRGHVLIRLGQVKKAEQAYATAAQLSDYLL